MSIRYRKISGGMYNDAKVLSLSKDAFFLWKSFLAGPCTTNIPGVLVGSKTVFIEATESWLNEHEFNAALAEIVGNKMAIADFQCKMVYLPNALKHQGERPNINQIKAWCNTWRDMRDCPLKWHIYHRLLRYIREMDATSKSPSNHTYELAFSSACEAPKYVNEKDYTDPFETLYPDQSKAAVIAANSGTEKRMSEIRPETRRTIAIGSDKRPRNKAWRDLRQSVFNRDGFKCVYCGIACNAPHCDHVIPVSRGGNHDESNLATACPPCNLSKSNMTISEWRASQ